MARQTRDQLFAEGVYEKREIEVLNRLALARNRARHPLIARMDEIALHGRYDRKDGFNRLYRGAVAGEAMMAQVIEQGGELLIGFFTPDGDLRRRLLVTSDADHWLEIDGVAVLHYGKYRAAAVTIIARRLFERGQVGRAA